ncbi:transposase, IS110 family [Klebsiella oxytoca]|nr:transposase, IS110 family [Klebsiella oxytoca]
MAAYLGLVPRQHSSGGKARLGHISKRGDRYVRTLIIHGARAVLNACQNKTDRRSQWLQGGVGETKPEHRDGGAGEQECPYSMGAAES